MEHDNLDTLDGWAHTAILIKDNIKYKRRKYLEINGISSVWIQVGVPGQKHFLLQSLYRQFQRAGNKASKRHENQLARWKTILDKWVKATDEDREVITIGDINLDSLVWDLPWEALSPYDRQRASLYEELKQKILTGGTTKINTTYTRVDDQLDRRKSCLDHFYTNYPLKINNHVTHHSTFSDHALLEVNKTVKKK